MYSEDRESVNETRGESKKGSNIQGESYNFVGFLCSEDRESVNETRGGSKALLCV